LVVTNEGVVDIVGLYEGSAIVGENVSLKSELFSESDEFTAGIIGRAIEGIDIVDCKECSGLQYGPYA
jgi:predicted hydrocarbon binding protein